MYLVLLRDNQKNGHFLVNFTGTEGEVERSAAMRRKTSSDGAEDDDAKCGVGFFLKNGEMVYLYDESFGLKIYTTTRALAMIVKMALRGFLDAVCIHSPASAFLKLLPFAPQILQILHSFPQISPILPTLAELEEKKTKKKPYSRFTVPTVATFDHYFRGPRGTDYVAESPWDIVPWNKDEETLSDELREAWMAEDEEKEDEDEEDEDEDEDETLKKAMRKNPFQQTKDKLEASIWLKANYRIELNSDIPKQVVYQNYVNSCTQSKLMDAPIFGRLLAKMFKNIKGTTGSGKKMASYTNLATRGE